MALTPNGFPENHPASMKREMALAQTRAAGAELRNAKSHFTEAANALGRSISLAAQSVHSRAGAVYRTVGKTLGF